MSRALKKLTNLPAHPGCYLFKNKTGAIIYVGKAKNLKKRVSTYWQKDISDWKTDKLVSEVADIDFVITDNELEAILLEAKLIQENQPQYNMKLKGGVRYAYIKITDEQFPRLETTRIFKREDRIFGPFTLADTRKNLIQLTNTLFKLRVGKTKPKRVKDLYQIRCSTAPWRRLVSETEYQKDVAKAELLLKGKMTDLISELEREMKQYSEQQKFELAKIRRDQMAALQKLSEEQKVQLKKAYDQDVINYVLIANKFIVQLFNINKGVVSGRKEFKLPIKSDSSELLFNFMSQYYYSNEIPQEVIIPEKLKDQAVLQKYLTQLVGRKTKITIPQKGDKLKLLELVKKNILATLRRGDSAFFELQTKLHLPNFPLVIECFDVSNLGANQMVGSMVYFRNGLPDKDNYRRFRIKYQLDQSDFAAMHEIIFRRYYRLKIEKQEMPDLVLVDGGKPQLAAALSALKQLELQLPVAALAKKQEELFVIGQKYPIRLAKKSDALKLVQKIRDEAHRFAIKYHRLLRLKNLKESR